MNKSDFETKANKIAGAVFGIFILYGGIIALVAFWAFGNAPAIYGIVYLAVAFFTVIMGIFYKYILNGIVYTIELNKVIVQRQNDLEALVRRTQGSGYSTYGQSNNESINYGQSNNGYQSNGYSNNGYQNNGYSNNGF
jgi:uncharacterized membrane protein YgcG